ncbi:ribosomal-protein-alanine acetyltransferase [Brevundimonas sp. AAP58]|uniref:GNAT family N-acetyltransferase n=1 Tax=Brevundimonas sp. AAP58 TaxID=1523422 RepID=UPI0006B898FB|nr:GNAT family N-acetyltransferase [Brevundimonas sp. AAP58]KPF84825.1 ribosomal-protein-alanine acetyltransferase [Brevundimonas sp. AAP58]
MTDILTSELVQGLAAVHAEAFDAPWSPEAFAALLSQPGVFLELEPEGFILIQTAVDEAEILTLAVRPDGRRCGSATRLVERAASRAAVLGVERLFLEVAEDNAPARALYARLGFEPVGRRPRYYARPEGQPVDALLLARNLDTPLPTA